MAPRPDQVAEQSEDRISGSEHSRIKVTAVVPTFNRARLLREALESLLAQTVRPDRIIVVDDGSTDDTAEIVADLSGIEYVKQQNGGKSTALNRALGMIATGFVWIFDDDDLAIPTGLESMLDALRRAPDAEMVVGRHDHLLLKEGSWQRANASETFSDDAEASFSVDILFRCTVFQPAMLVRKDLYDRVGKFDPELTRSQDYEMLLRLVRISKVALTNEIIFSQRKHAGTRGSTVLKLATTTAKRDAWERYDRKIFEQIAKSYSLSDYVPESRRVNAQDEEYMLDALETKIVVLARRGLWDDAAQAVSEAIRVMKSPKHRLLHTGAAKIFGPASYNISGGHGFRHFVSALRRLPAAQWRRIRNTLAKQLVRKGYYASKAFDLRRSYQVWKLLADLLLQDRALPKPRAINR